MSKNNMIAYHYFYFLSNTEQEKKGKRLKSEKFKLMNKIWIKSYSVVISCVLKGCTYLPKALHLPHTCISHSGNKQRTYEREKGVSGTLIKWDEKKSGIGKREK